MPSGDHAEPTPSVDDLRFRLPVASDPYHGTYNATTFGPSCIQQTYIDPTASSQDPMARKLTSNAINNFAVMNITEDEDCERFQISLRCDYR